MKAFIRHSWGYILAAMGVTCLGMLFYLKSSQNVFALRKLIYAPAVVLVMAALLWLLTERLLRSTWEAIPRRTHLHIVLIALAGMAVGLVLFPVPQADFLQQHTLRIIPTQGSSGVVRIDRLRYLNGVRVLAEAVQTSSDWQVQGESYTTHGGVGSELKLQGSLPVGMMVFFTYLPEGGQVQVNWDGRVKNVVLYAPEGTNQVLVLSGWGVFELPLGWALLTVLLALAYAGGMFVLLAVGLVVIYRLTGKHFKNMPFWGVLGSSTVVFIVLKHMYLLVDDAHKMGDTLSYVTTAQYPLSSAYFWAGVRPFTLPLEIKLLGINLQNFAKMGELSRAAVFQLFFSMVCWGMLALVLSQATRRRWLGATLFAITLSFSLSMEISLWDSLLLSESLTFSLLALLIAGWVALIVLLPRMKSGWLRWGLVVVNSVVALLYCFVRDSNVYFALGMVLVLAAGSLLVKGFGGFRKYTLVSAGLIAAIFIGQYFSLSSGNRWQVFIYDHLAMRILNNPVATQFFAKEGLPLSDALFATTLMEGSEYQRLMDQSAELKPVKDWVACCSKAAYIKYLLSDPLKTLAEPLRNWQPLVNGSLRGYRNPKNYVTPMPGRLKWFSDFYFARKSWLLAGLTVLSLCGLGLFLWKRENPLWVVIAALVLPVIPMMYFIWFAEPMEIDRHAAQIGLQLRLAGWLSVPLLLDWLSQRIARLPWVHTWLEREVHSTKAGWEDQPQQ